LARRGPRAPKSHGCNELRPPSCLLYSLRLPSAAAFSVPICTVCWLEFPAPDRPACARCGDTLDIPGLVTKTPSVSFCRACRLAPPPFVRAVAFGLYQGRMKAAIHALKYDRLHPAARGWAACWLRPSPNWPAKPQPRCWWFRCRCTGRNMPSAASTRPGAGRACASLPAQVPPRVEAHAGPSTLMRLRATEPGRTHPRERRLNVRGAFTVSDPAAVASKHILLIDDILTTGATARAAAQALVRAGAASVWVATLARARRQRGALCTRREAFEGRHGFRQRAGAVTEALQHESTYSSQDQPSF
jgi:predicted amidophosphoribosyltransferase